MRGRSIVRLFCYRPAGKSGGEKGLRGGGVGKPRMAARGRRREQVGIVSTSDSKLKGCTV